MRTSLTWLARPNLRLLAIAERRGAIVCRSLHLGCGEGDPSIPRCGFLQGTPWERLGKLRKRTTNILFQMLLRASNTVGTQYPTTSQGLHQQERQLGIDVFRVFDS